MVGALIGEDGGPDKAGRAKIRCLFRPGPPLPGTTRVKRGPIAGLTRFCRARGGVRFATPMRRHPLPALPRIRLRPKAGFGETSAGEGAHHLMAGTEMHRMFEKTGWDRQTR